MADNIIKIRELLGSKWLEFILKLSEWSKSETTQIDEFHALMRKLYNSNLKLTCRMIGKIVSPIRTDIADKNFDIFGSERYMSWITEEVLQESDSSHEFNFQEIFNSEDQHTWGADVQTKFWKYMEILSKLYSKLVTMEMKDHSGIEPYDGMVEYDFNE